MQKDKPRFKSTYGGQYPHWCSGKLTVKMAHKTFEIQLDVWDVVEWPEDFPPEHRVDVREIIDICRMSNFTERQGEFKYCCGGCFDG